MTLADAVNDAAAVAIATSGEHWQLDWASCIEGDVYDRVSTQTIGAANAATHRAIVAPLHSALNRRRP